MCEWWGGVVGGWAGCRGRAGGLAGKGDGMMLTPFPPGGGKGAALIRDIICARTHARNPQGEGEREGGGGQGPKARGRPQGPACKGTRGKARSSTPPQSWGEEEAKRDVKGG